MSEGKANQGNALKWVFFIIIAFFLGIFVYSQISHQPISEVQVPITGGGAKFGDAGKPSEAIKKPVDVANGTLRITYPSPNDRIETPQTVKGVSSLLPNGKYAWILSRFKGIGPSKYWAPQEEITNLTSWEITAWIGGATNETDNKYEIAAVIVNGASNEYLHYYKKYANDCNKISSDGMCYPGVLLPDADIQSSIEVFRK